MQRRASYLRVDVIGKLLEERFGLDLDGTGTANDAAIAECFGLGSLTVYRQRKQVVKASNELITAVMETFPDKRFRDLFETRDETRRDVARVA